MGLFGGINKKKLSEVYPECVRLYKKGKLEKVEKLLNPFTGKQKESDYLLGLVLLELGKKHRDADRLESARKLLKFAASCGHKGAAELVAREYGDTKYLKPTATTAAAKPAVEPVRPAAPVQPVPAPQPEKPAESSGISEPDEVDMKAVFEEAFELYDDEMYELAFDLMLEAAEGNVPDAAFYLALMYSLGEGTEQDLEEAQKWASIAAEQDVENADKLLENINALLEDAFIEEEEEDEEEDDEEEEFSFSGKLPPPKTLEEQFKRQLYEYYEPVDDFDAALHAYRMGDIAKAKAMLTRLAAEGNKEAGACAAVCDDAAAFHNWLKTQAFLSYQKNIRTALALNYLYGPPEVRDIDRAGLIAHEAEEVGDTHVSILRMLIATFAEEELKRGVQAFRAKEYETAYKYFLKASERCCDEADYYRGLMYRDGLYVKKSLPEGMRLIQKAARHSCDSAVIEMAKAYISGQGQPVNYYRARYWAQRTLGRELKQLVDDMDGGLYYFRHGDYDEALERLAEGVDMNCMDAAYYSGVIHRDKLAEMTDKWLSEEAFSRLKAGCGLSFGSFHDKNRTEPRPLTWQIIKLDRENRRMLLLCDFALGSRCFDSSDRPWATCDLRAWLNGEALRKYFTPWEQQQILDTRNTSGRTAVMDKLWLPTIDFVKGYVDESNLLNGAIRWGSIYVAYPDSEKVFDKLWLLSSEGSSKGAYYIGAPFLADKPASKQSELGVRPMMWLKY